MSLPPELKQRILAAARAEPAPARAQVMRLTLALATVAVVLPMVAFLAVGGVRTGLRPPSLVLATTGGALAIATATLMVALSRGRQMLGQARGLLLVAGIAAPLLFLAWKAGLSTEFGMTESGPVRTGYRCLILTFTFAVVPLAALIYTRRGSDPAHPRSLGLALGAGVGTAAAALVDLWCPIGRLGHLLFGHVLPVLALGGLGVWLGQRWLALRST